MEGSVEVAGNLSLKNVQVLLDVYHMLGNILRALNILLAQYPYDNPIRWCRYCTHFTDRKTRERNSCEAT